MTSEKEYARQVIWGIGGKRAKNVIHAYLNTDTYLKGFTLCGCGTRPVYEIEFSDLQDLEDHICPVCRSRLQLLRFLKEGDRK